MTSVLVVSDNLELAEYLIQQSRTIEIADLASFTFKFSTNNKSSAPLRALGMDPINIREPKVLEKAIRDYDLVLSLHCKQIFPVELVRARKCINVHPGFNPSNRGWYAQVFSIINGLPFGATIHEMDEYLDHGPIIDQELIETMPFHTSSDLYRLVIDLEKRLLGRNLVNILTENYIAHQPSSEGNFNSLKDFRELCKLDLDHSGTLKEHIDLLRALSHKGFNNAYFIEGGQKVFVNIDLKPDFV